MTKYKNIKIDPKFNKKLILQIQKMIQIEIQEWQQMKAKLSQLEQQVVLLRAQNQNLKKELKYYKNHKQQKNSSVNISFGQNILSNDKTPSSELQQNSRNVLSQSMKNSGQRKRCSINQIGNNSQPNLATIQQKSIESPQKVKSRKSILLNRNSNQKTEQNIQRQKNIILEQLGLQNQISSTFCENDNLENHEEVIIVSRKSYKSIQSRKSLAFGSMKKHQQQNISPLDNNQNGTFQTNNFQIAISPSPPPLLQDICVFGPNLQNLQNVTFKHDQNQFVQPCIYFPSIVNNSKSAQLYRPYSNYIYPRKVRIKPTQKMNIPIQANKIIFKNSRKQECNIFIFQAIQSQLTNIQTQVLQQVNPSKWLYGIVMEFNDFVFRQSPAAKSMNVIDIKPVQQLQTQCPQQAFSPGLGHKNKHSTLLSLDQNKVKNQQIKMQSVSLKDIQFQKQKQHMYRSTFNLCVFTYYPFINYFQKLLASIFDQIKLKRIQNLPKTGQFKDCDIFYFIQQLNTIIQKIKVQCSYNYMRMYEQIKIHVGDNLISLQLKEQNIQQNLYDKWVYKTMKMMDKDTFYQIYTIIMLQESIYFVCQDQKLLTFIIFLFAGILTQPFSYPYPVVSVIFSQQLLQTPFTSIIGVNQSQKWVQKAQQSNLIDFKTKHVAIITQKQVKLRHDTRYTPPKSNQLKKLFSQLYKKIQPSVFPNILRRNSIMTSLNNIPITNQSSKQFSKFIMQFFNELKQYFDENIMSFLPNKMTIEKIGGQMSLKKYDQQINKANLRNYLLDQIEKLYKKSNVNYSRDPFIKQFIDTQIFSIYLMEEYQIS